MHSHSLSIHISINVFDTIFHSPGRFPSFSFLMNRRHFGTCWQKWQLAFVNHRFYSQKPPKLLVLPLSISAIYYDKLRSFLAQNYKRRLQFAYFYGITSSVNSSLRQPSYSLSLWFIGFWSTAWYAFPFAQPPLFTLHYPLSSQTNWEKVWEGGEETLSIDRTVRNCSVMEKSIYFDWIET